MAWRIIDQDGTLALIPMGGALPSGSTLIGETDDANYLLPPPPPDTVTPRQIRLALNAAGLRATIEAAVASADQDTRDTWEFALEIRRDDPLIIGMCSALGLTDAQVDEVFRLAGTF